MELCIEELDQTWSATPSAGPFISYGNDQFLPTVCHQLTADRYGNLKDMIQSYRGQGKRLNAGDYFLASGTSGEHIHHGTGRSARC